MSLAQTEKLVFINSKGEKFEISTESDFFPESVEGLEQIKNETYTAKTYGADGEVYISSVVQTRDINITGRILDNRINNRKRMISFFKPKEKLMCKYVNGEIERFIDCTMDSTPKITKDVLPKFTINVTCHNPYWYGQEQRTDIALWIGTFEFPLDIKEEGIEMGYRSKSLIVNVNNDSDIDSSLIVKFYALGSVTNPHIINVDTQEILKVECDMVGGDILTVTTKTGEESVILTRGGKDYNYLNYLTLDSNLKMVASVGDNLIRYNADVSADNLEVSIYHLPQYVGV